MNNKIKSKLIRTKDFNQTIKSLCLHKPPNITYYQHAVDMFLSPISSEKRKRAILDAFKKYSETDNIHIKLGLLAKTYVKYYNSNFTNKQFLEYLKFYTDNIIVD